MAQADGSGYFLEIVGGGQVLVQNAGVLHGNRAGLFSGDCLRAYPNCMQAGLLSLMS